MEIVWSRSESEVRMAWKINMSCLRLFPQGEGRGTSVHRFLAVSKTVSRDPEKIVNTLISFYLSQLKAIRFFTHMFFFRVRTYCLWMCAVTWLNNEGLSLRKLCPDTELFDDGLTFSLHYHIGKYIAITIICTWILIELTATDSALYWKTHENLYHWKDKLDEWSLWRYRTCRRI